MIKNNKECQVRRSALDDLVVLGEALKAVE